MNSEYTQMESNILFLRDNFTLETLMSWGFISQLLLVLLVIGSAFLAEYLIRKRLSKKYVVENQNNLKDIFKLFRPSFMLAVLFSAMFFLREGDLQWRLLYFANSILVILIFVRLAIIFTRYILKPGPWLRPFENIFAAILVSGYLAYQLGILKQLQLQLQSINFIIADQNITMLLIVESILGVFIAILIAMTLARFIENRIMSIKSRSFRANQRIVVIKVLKILLYIFAIVLVLSTLGIDLSLGELL